MNIFQALILSLVEGVTEFLPISSTGHLILASKVLGIEQSEFVKSFEIAIQLGAILSVVYLYAPVLIKEAKIWKTVLLAFLPTGVLGFFLYSFVKNNLIGNSNVVIVSLLIGGIAMLFLENLNKKKVANKSIEKLSVFDALIIGLVQSISMIPGVSRAMATIFGGLGVGMNKKSAVEFSFLLAVPTMLSATVYDLFKTRFVFEKGEYLLLAIGFVGAFLSALFAVKALINYIQKHNFFYFGVYRIVLAILFWSLS